MPSVNLATDQARVASAVSALRHLKRQGILTTGVVGGITSSGTTTKLLAALAAQYATLSTTKIQPTFEYQYERGMRNLRTAIRSKVLTDALVEAARALVSGDKADKLIADLQALSGTPTNPAKHDFAMVE